MTTGGAALPAFQACTALQWLIYPSRPITTMAPFRVGEPTEPLARIVAAVELRHDPGFEECYRSSSALDLPFLFDPTPEGPMSSTIARRKFIAVLGGAAAASWPRLLRAQQKALPVVGFVTGRSAETSTHYLAAFRQGLKEAGFVEGQKVTVEYHWLDGHYDRLRDLMTDLVRRQVAVITTPGSNPAALAANAATGIIPIVFGVGEDPVRLGLVASLARPGGNATGVNFFGHEVAGKALLLLHDVVPKATRIAVLVNPANPSVSEDTIALLQKAAPTIGLTIDILKATTIGEIDAVFDGFASKRPDGLFVAADGFFSSRSRQFVALEARDKIPAIYWNRDFVVAGGLMSYGTDLADTYRQVGVYTGKILSGANPAEMAVVQSTKFVFAINQQTARALGIQVPPEMLAIADEVIE